MQRAGKDSESKVILEELKFTHEMMHGTTIGELSGGWQMKKR